MPKIIYSSSPDSGIIKPNYLHDAVNTTNSRLRCGLTVVASITGKTVTEVRDAFRLHRFGARWPNYDRAPAITSTRPREVEAVLRLCGYIGHWRTLCDRPTVAAYLESRSGIERSHPCVVYTGSYCIAVSGWVVCDVFSRGVVIDAQDARRRRARVDDVFVVTGRVQPDNNIPSKPSTPRRMNKREAKLDKLFRAAIKAETGATSVKLTSTEAFIMRPNTYGRRHIGPRDSVSDWLERPNTGCHVRGHSNEAAAYRAALNL
ncbi:hypothetical protein [Pseudorhizobium pelagicum]|nr:hypothetical protein [Pseudorhizobium pelagicum]KEQ03791.1 hypothetical protein GV67_12165 [Pseudorhizobium pelagicum]